MTVLDRLRIHWEQYRRPGIRDRGFVLITALLLMMLVASASLVVMHSSARSTANAINARDFVQSGQMADSAIQSAVYQLNNNQSAVIPTTQSAAVTGSSNGGNWAWWTDPEKPDYTRAIHATGTFRTVVRRVDATVGRLAVGGYTTRTVGSSQEIDYKVAPTSAFNHSIMSPTITVQDGTGSPANFLTGTVGVLNSPPIITTNTGGAPAVSASYKLYGSGAAKTQLSPSLTVPVGLQLDSKYVTDNLYACQGTAVDWVASKNGAVLQANGNTGCFRSMTFDVPTRIDGSGAFNAFVSGDVTFNDNVQTSGNALNVYTAGSVAFDTEKVSSASLNLQHIFIYAPNGTCKTNPQRSLTRSFTFTGSLACNAVNVAGTINGDTPVGALGNDTFSSNIWYLANYQQPSGGKK